MDSETEDDLVLDMIGNKLKIEEDDKSNEVKIIKHYKSSQKILLIGEGDFSFATCLANHFGNASNLFATSLDSHDGIMEKYSEGESNLEVLQDKSCTILHQVDAHTFSTHAVLKLHRFDKIVFNFPHAGVPYRSHRRRGMIKAEHHYNQIELHKDLIKGFLKSAYKLLSDKGEIHITHKTTHPFDCWNITELAEDAGLKLMAQVPFCTSEYPGYCNKKGEWHGNRCDHTFPVGECSTFMFSVR